MITEAQKMEIKNTEKQMMKNVYVEKAWTIIRKKLKGITLDIGCGTGMVTYVHTNVIGVDISETISLIPLIRGDAYRLPFKKNVFDTIVMSHVLEHFPESERILKECYRVLKRNGNIIISVPNLDTFSANLFGKRYGYVFNPDQHKQFFDIKKLKADVSKYFSVEENFGTTPTFPYADYLMNLKPFRKLWWMLGDLNKEHTIDIIVIAKKNK